MEDLIIKIFNEIEKVKVNIFERVDYCNNIDSALDSLNEIQQQIENQLMENQFNSNDRTKKLKQFINQLNEQR